MSIDLTVNGTTFAYPENGEEPGWGKEAADWASEVTDVLNDLQNTNDITQTSFNIANNTTSATNVTGLLFSTTTVRGAVIDYAVYRNTNSNELAEFGQLTIVYKSVAATWEIAQFNVGSSGVTLTITSAGQFQYTSTNMSGTGYSGVMHFRAKVLTQ